MRWSYSKYRSSRHQPTSKPRGPTAAPAQSTTPVRTPRCQRVLPDQKSWCVSTLGVLIRSSWLAATGLAAGPLSSPKDPPRPSRTRGNPPRRAWDVAWMRASVAPSWAAKADGRAGVMLAAQARREMRFNGPGGRAAGAAGQQPGRQSVKPAQSGEHMCLVAGRRVAYRELPKDDLKVGSTCESGRCERARPRRVQKSPALSHPGQPVWRPARQPPRTGAEHA